MICLRWLGGYRLALIAAALGFVAWNGNMMGMIYLPLLVWVWRDALSRREAFFFHLHLLPRCQSGTTAWRGCIFRGSFTTLASGRSGDLDRSECFAGADVGSVVGAALSPHTTCRDSVAYLSPADRHHRLEQPAYGGRDMVSWYRLGRFNGFYLPFIVHGFDIIAKVGLRHSVPRGRIKHDVHRAENRLVDSRQHQFSSTTKHS
jgi:hypothetical protein